jgi:plasmid stability protein
MTLILELPDSKEAALKAKARAHGVSAEQYAAQLVERGLSEGGTQSVSAMFREIWSGMPDDVRAKLPPDGTSQIDHYVYGVPKSRQ